VFVVPCHEPLFYGNRFLQRKKIFSVTPKLQEQKNNVSCYLTFEPRKKNETSLVNFQKKSCACLAFFKLAASWEKK